MKQFTREQQAVAQVRQIRVHAKLPRITERSDLLRFPCQALIGPVSDLAA